MARVVVVDSGVLIASVLQETFTRQAEALLIAERFDCEFWTIDEKLFNAARLVLPHVRWLGEHA